MIRPHIICDVCSRDATAAGRLDTLELVCAKGEYQPVHVCCDCFRRPIGDLAEIVRGYEVRFEKERLARLTEHQVGGLLACPGGPPPSPR